LHKCVCLAVTTCRTSFERLDFLQTLSCATMRLINRKTARASQRLTAALRCHCPWAALRCHCPARIRRACDLFSGRLVREGSRPRAIPSQKAETHQRPCARIRQTPLARPLARRAWHRSRAIGFRKPSPKISWRCPQTIPPHCLTKFLLFMVYRLFLKTVQRLPLVVCRFRERGRLISTDSLNVYLKNANFRVQVEGAIALIVSCVVIQCFGFIFVKVTFWPRPPPNSEPKPFILVNNFILAALSQIRNLITFSWNSSQPADFSTTPRDFSFQEATRVKIFLVVFATPSKLIWKVIRSHWDHCPSPSNTESFDCHPSCWTHLTRKVIPVTWLQIWQPTYVTPGHRKPTIHI